MNREPTFSAISTDGLIVRELEPSDLTRCERAVFGIPEIQPIAGLQHHNAGIDCERGDVRPEDVESAATNLPIYPTADQARGAA